MDKSDNNDEFPPKIPPKTAELGKPLHQVGDDLMDTMPPATQVADSGPPGQQGTGAPGGSASGAQPNGAGKSADGDWDPWARDKDGNILKRRDGKPKKRPGRRPKGPQIYDKDAQGAEARAEEERRRKEAEARQNQELLGATAANLTFTVGMMISEDYAPIVDPTTGQNEPEFMTRAWGNYFAAKGVEDIPPGLALVMTLTTYFGSRFNKERTRKRYIDFLGRAKVWWTEKMKARRARKKDRAEAKKANRAAPAAAAAKREDPDLPAATHPDYQGGRSSH